MEGEQPEKAVDLSAVKTADLVRELKARFAEIQQAQAELGMDTVAPVTPRARTSKSPSQDLRKTQPKSLTWRIAQGERWLKSAKSRGDKAGIQKYEQRVKELKKSAHASGD